MNNRVCTTNAFYHILLENCCRWKTKPTLNLGLIRSPVIIYSHMETIIKMLHLDREQSVTGSLIELSCFYSHRLPKQSVVLLLTLPRRPVSHALIGVFDVVMWPALGSAKLLCHTGTSVFLKQSTRCIDWPPLPRVWWHFNHSQIDHLASVLDILTF